MPTPSRSRARAAAQAFSEEVLARLASMRDASALRARAMFGGHGLFHGQVFFGILAAERLYLRVDDDSRSEYERLGSGPFRFGANKVLRVYYEAPAEVFDDPMELSQWAEASLAAALRARASSKRRTRKKPG